MSLHNNTVEKNKDPIKNAIEKNPCGLCRVQGIPVCRGHGSGGGGSGTSTGAAKNSASGSTGLVLSASSSANPALAADISALLSQNGNWTRTDVLESIFHFENPDALLSLNLDMERGLIGFYGNKNLSAEECLLLDELFSTIENELDVFKKELAEKDSTPELIAQIKLERELDINSLTLKFPRPTFYDTFVKRLVDKNLLPVESAPQNDKTRDLFEYMLSSDEVEAHQTTAPTPFDISGGPKPNAASHGEPKARASSPW